MAPVARNVQFIEEATAEAADEALRAAAPAADDLLVIDGGDGTVQRSLSLLLADGRRADALPRLALLPSGSTNMTAFAVSGPVRHARALVALTAAIADPERAFERRQEALSVIEATVRRAGFFFGGGLIVAGIRYWQQEIKARGGGDEWASALAVFRSLVGVARGESAFAQPLQMAADGQPPALLRLAMVTTLDRLLLGFQPLSGSGSGGLRTMTVGADVSLAALAASCLWRSARRPDGLISWRAEALSLAFAGSYTVDGELFDCEAGLRIETAGPLRCLVLR